MNLRPSGYEPDELPDCSTPQLRGGIIQKVWLCGKLLEQLAQDPDAEAQEPARHQADREYCQAVQAQHESRIHPGL